MNNDENLRKISPSCNLCLFPLRLETRFFGTGADKQLRVRIIPDEILLDYQKKGVNPEEAEDGKRFWIQWYIASGSERREYEAWLNLCSKYPVARAAWICRCLKPPKFDDYKKGGKLFGHRPFPGISEIEAACERIYKNLGDLPIDEKGFIKQSNTDAFEDNVTHLCQEMLKDVYDICKSLRQTTVVDYLYDSVLEMANHLKRRLESISKIYDEHPELKSNVTFDQTKDLDYWSLNDLTNVINEFIRDYKIEFRQSLPDMMNEYLKRMDVKGNNCFFANYETREKKNLEIPEATFLPDFFVLFGEAVDGNKNVVKEYVAYSSTVDRNGIKFTIDPNKKSNYSVGKDGLSVDSSVQWMFDYDAAIKAGMAITVPVSSNVKGFNYIYVLGVKTSSSDDVEKLLNGHNYFGSSVQLVDPRMSSNIVDGEVPVDQEELEKRRRFEIEVNGKFILTNGESNDANLLAQRLKVDYARSVGRISNFESSREEKTKKAYEIMWKMVDPKYDPKVSSRNNFVGKLFIEHVRATGNVPSFKIGNMPYGILPVSDYSSLYKNMSAGYRKDLLGDLLILNEKWSNLSKSKVKTIFGTGVEAEKSYLRMVGQTPYSVSFVSRDELRSSLIVGNVPTLKVDGNRNLALLKGLFDDGLCASQAIANTDKLFDIKKSKLVKALMEKESSGEPMFSQEEAVNFATEFIDLFTYRLDAWFNAILDDIMASVNNSCSIGTYGWVFNLEEKSTSVSNADKDHFIVAPSIQHALSAAVLRSAYLKSQSNKKDSHVCVNLSSMRARQALRLIDGIRSGMSMSVVLGCDLERYLHDAALHGEKGVSVELDKFIYPLRQLFPQTVNVEAQDSRAEDHVMQVINGEALLETIINHDEWTWDCSVHEWLSKHRSDADMGWLRDEDLKMTEKETKVFYNIIERLMDSYDALNDLLLSEGVHRLVMGDQASFYAIGNFMANGEGGLPDPEILKTPSEHAVISHKIGLMLPQNDSAATKPLSIVEPGLDAWVESLIGGMDKICFYVKRQEKGEDVIEPYSLKYVNISASEYLYLSAYPATFKNYIETRWRLKTGNTTGDVAILECCEDATVSCSSSQLCLEDDSFRIQTIRNMLKNAHGMLPSDWISDIQEDTVDEALVNRTELVNRVQALLDKANKHLSLMTHWLYQTSIVDNVTGRMVFNGEFDDEKVSAAYQYLCDSIEFGLVSCFTGYNSGAFAGQFDRVLQFKERDHSVTIQEELFDMVLAARDDLQSKVDDFNEQLAFVEGDYTKATSSLLIEAVQKLCLKNIKIFPKFRLENDKLGINSFVTSKSFGNFNDKLNSDSFDQWQDEVAEVREGMRSISNLSMAQAALNKDAFSVSILQTSTKLDGNSFSGTPKLTLVGDDWLGLPVDDEGKLRDVDSLVLYNLDKNSFKSEQYNSGFIFDGWMEYIPYKKHNAGIVFHCDRPDAEAPQSVLLAYNPENGCWTHDRIKAILRMTYQMIKNRAVEPDFIYEDEELSRVFPLLGNKFGSM